MRDFDNKATIEAYMAAFGETDRERILACLTDDVEWVLPGVFHVRGKDAFATHIVDDGFAGRPLITVTRLEEETDVVVAEGLPLLTYRRYATLLLVTTRSV